MATYVLGIYNPPAVPASITWTPSSNTSFIGGNPVGQIISTATVTMSPTSAAFAGTLVLAFSDQSHYAFSGNTLVTAVTPLSGTPVNIVAVATQNAVSTSSGGTLTVSPIFPAVQSISLSPPSPSINQSVAIGTVVTTATVAMSLTSAVFPSRGTLSLAISDASSFAVSGLNIVTAITPLSVASHSLLVVATDPLGASSTSNGGALSVTVTGTVPTGITWSPPSPVISVATATSTVVATATVAVSPTSATFGGTLALAVSDASTFAVSGLSVITAISPLSFATHSVVAVATQNGTSTSSGGALSISATSGAGALVATFSLVNFSSGTTAPSNFITPTFGHPFKQGDIPAGATPLFQINGTNVPYSVGMKRTWLDGSLKYAAFMMRVPVALTSGASVTVQVYSSGPAVGVTQRSLAEVATQNIIISTGSGVSNLSGTWVSSLTSGINTGQDIALYVSGDAGTIWRVRAPFTTLSGTTHGQLENYHYVAALTANGGGLYGFRYLPRISQPWYNANTFSGAPVPDRRVFSEFKIQYQQGGLQQIDPFAVYQPQTFTVNSGGGNTTMTTSSGHGWDTGMGAILSTTGTLPTELTAGPYWVQVGANNTFQLLQTPIAPNVQLVTVLTSGTGVHTLTPVPYVVQFGSLYGADSRARWQYIQGTGATATDVPVRVVFDKNYIRSTRTILPYDFTWNVTPNSTFYPWRPYTAGPILRHLGQTGERDDIGPLTSYQARHIYTQSSGDEQMVRVIGMTQAHLATNLRDRNLRGLINFADPVRTYTGMSGSSQATIEFRPSVPLAAGMTQPASSGWLQGFDANTDDHMPSMSYYAYLISGEPQYMDMVAEMGNIGLLAYPPGDRNKTTASTNYYGMQFSGRDTFRAGAWAGRDVAYAGGILPDVMPDGSATNQYFRDLMNINYGYAITYSSTQSQWWNDTGFFQPQANTNGRSVWQYGYMCYATEIAVALGESSSALGFLQHMSKWPTYVGNTYGMYNATAYYERTFLNEPTDTVIISNQSGWGGYNNGTLNFSTAGVSQFQWIGTAFSATNNDVFIFPPINGNTGGPGCPGGLVPNVTYFAINVTSNATVFDLSLTPGGPAVTLTSNGQFTDNVFFIQIQNNPKLGGMADSVSPASYGQNLLGWMNAAQALGVTGLTSAVANMTVREASVNLATDPKFAMTTTF